MKIVKKFYGKIAPSTNKRLVLENFLSLSLFQLINLLIPLITIPYLVRTLGPSKYGLIAFAQTFVQYFITLTDYGFNISATREISIHKDDQTKVSAIFNSVLLIKLFFLLLGFIVICLAIALIPRFRNDWLIYLLSYGSVLGNVLFCSFFFQGMEKMKYILFLNLLGLLPALSLFIFIKSEQDFLWAPLILSLGSVAVGMTSLRTIHKRFNIKFVLVDWRAIRHQLRAGWRIFLSSIAISGYTNTRVFAVGLLTNNRITGYYSIADKLMSLLGAFPLGIFVQAAYPRLSKIFFHDKKKAMAIIHKLQAFAIVGYSIFLPLVFIFSRHIVTFFCGSPYPEVILSLRLLLPALFFAVANAFKVNLLLVAGRSDIFLKIHILMGLAGSAIIFALTYFFSYIGAAAGIIFIELFILIVTGRFLRKAQIE